MSATRITFLAVFLLGSAAAAKADIHEEISELQKEIAEWKQAHGDSGALESGIEAAAAEQERLKGAIPELERQISQMESLRNIYRSAYRVVSVVAPGTALGDLSLRDGTTVANAVYTGADASGIFVTTEAGPRSVARELLPEAVQARFQFPPDFAESGGTLADLLAKKPDVLVSGDPVGMVAEAPSVGETAPSAPTGGAATADTSAAPVAAAAAAAATPDEEENAAKEARNRDRQQMIAKLRVRYTEVRNMRNEASRERFRERSEMMRSKIKKSQVEIDKVMALHDMKIKSLEEEERELRQQIDLLFAAME